MIKKQTALVSILTITTLIGVKATAASLEVDLSNDTLHGKYTATRSDADLSISAGAMAVEDSATLAYLNLRTHGQLSTYAPAKGGLGGKVYIVNVENRKNFQALGLGGALNLDITGVEGLSVDIEFYYAPGASTSSSYEGLKDANVRVNFQAFENASVFAGARSLKVEREDSDDTIKLDSGAYLGFAISF